MGFLHVIHSKTKNYYSQSVEILGVPRGSGVASLDGTEGGFSGTELDFSATLGLL